MSRVAFYYRPLTFFSFYYILRPFVANKLQANKLNFMYAVIATGGKQYLVKTGDVLKIEKLPIAEGGKVVFDKVLLTANDDGTDVKVGKPYVEGVIIEATLEKQGKERTLRVEKFKRKVRYHKVHGQRQRFSLVKIA